MTVLGLKKARHLLESRGWVGPELEPFSVDASGARYLVPNAKLVRFSVDGALVEAGAWPDGWYLLEQVIAPAHAAEQAFCSRVKPEALTPELFREWQRLCRAALAEPTLEQWLAAEGRKNGEVLRAFVLAIQRGKKSGERRG